MGWRHCRERISLLSHDVNPKIRDRILGIFFFFTALQGSFSSVGVIPSSRSTGYPLKMEKRLAVRTVVTGKRPTIISKLWSNRLCSVPVVPIWPLPVLPNTGWAFKIVILGLSPCAHSQTLCQKLQVSSGGWLDLASWNQAWSICSFSVSIPIISTDDTVVNKITLCT